MIDPTSPEALGWLTLSGASLIAAFNQGSQMLDRWRGKPAAELLEKENQQTNARLSKLEVELKELEKRIIQDKTEASERRRNIYEKIEAMRADVKEDIKGIHQRLDIIFQTASRTGI